MCLLCQRYEENIVWIESNEFLIVMFVDCSLQGNFNGSYKFPYGPYFITEAVMSALCLWCLSCWWLDTVFMLVSSHVEFYFMCFISRLIVHLRFQRIWAPFHGNVPNRKSYPRHVILVGWQATQKSDVKYNSYGYCKGSWASIYWKCPTFFITLFPICEGAQ